MLWLIFSSQILWREKRSLHMLKPLTIYMYLLSCMEQSNIKLCQGKYTCPSAD